MKHAIDIARKRFSGLGLNGPPVIAACCTTDNDVKTIPNALKPFVLNYNANVRRKSQLMAMSWIIKSFNNPECYLQSPFMFEIRMCGKINYEFCSKTERNFHETIIVGYHNIRD